MKRDPIYEDDTGRKQADTIGDALSLGMGGYRQATAREAATNQLLGTELPTYGGALQGAQYAGDFDPTLYDTPEAAQYALANEAPEGRAAMLDALRALRERSDQSIASQQELDRFRARQDADQMASAREGAIRMDAMRRGKIGSAADMIMRGQAAQMGANRNLEGGLQSAQMAALQRLKGTEAEAGMANQLRAGDQAMGFANADIINRFNMANTGARNAQAAKNVELQNMAGLGNLERKQAYQNQLANVANENQTRLDELAGKRFSQDLARRGAISNAMTGQAVGAEKQDEGTQKAAQMMMRFLAGAGG